MRPSQQTARLDTELERAALRAALGSYVQLNAALFRSALKVPRLEFVPSSERLGRWLPERRTIELSPRLIREHGWGALVEVLKHEMAHQYVAEILACNDEPPHGPSFQEVCRARAIDARACGVPPAAAAVGAEAKLLERVAKLLALAQSPNLHEAEAAMSAAQRLMLKHNLDLTGHGTLPSYSYRHLGKPSGRTSEAERHVANLLAEHFFVEAIWVPVWRTDEGKRGSVLEVCGTPENLELAAYVYDFLMNTAEQLWREHKRQSGISRDRDRRNYLAGVVSGFAQKLDAERSRARAHGLIWRGDAELGRYFRRRHPYVRTTRFGGAPAREGFEAGHAAGRRLVLRRGMQSGPSGPTRLLPGRAR